ncbi:MAG TPA: VOC family protein [Acidimicrobiia bacterium]|nr:VOC family protein [Acidimicrobiia bacterium]
MIPVKTLNHAVLYVRDAQRSSAFYQQALDFEVVGEMGRSAVFLRASRSDNHHDLALFSVGSDAPGPQHGGVGLYHLAWEVATIDDLVDARVRLLEMGALVGESDHGVSKSLYAKDVDGIEFEVLWSVPREEWGEYEHNAVSQPLDLAAEQARFGSRAAR